MIAYIQIDWESVFKSAGPLGVVFILAVIGFVGGAKWLKNFVEGTLADARKDRDAARSQLDAQASRFLESLKLRDEIQEKGFDEILRELRNNTTRRK
jgi:hypothetical protein